MRLLLLLLAALMVAPCCSALDREAFTFTNYDLDVRVEPSQQRLAVRGKIKMRNDSGSPQRNLSIQISSTLAWRSIKVAGTLVQFVAQPYTTDIDHSGAVSEAIVTLPKDVPPNGIVEVEVGYEGTIPLDASRLTRMALPETEAKHSDWDQIGESYTAVRGIGYVAWYPVATDSANLSEGNTAFETVGRWQNRAQSSEMRINLCTINSGPVPLMVFMNDPRNSSETVLPNSNEDSCQTHSFSPLGFTVPAFVIGKYELLDHSNVQVYYQPDHKGLASDYALATDLAEQFVRDWFGAPSGKAKLLELTDSNAAPFESGTLLLAPLEIAKDSRLAQMTAVHQLTHAAFNSNRPWLEEGVAHFAQAIFREQQAGREAALDFMGLHRAALSQSERTITAENKPANAADQSLINTTLQELYRSKAMYVWWMLRDMLGDAALKKALRLYKSDQDKDPAYVQHLIESQTKRDLEWFFDDWVYRDKGLPDFRVDAAIPRATLAGGYIVTVTVENIGGAGAEVPIKLVVDGGEVSKRLQVPGKFKASIRIEVPSTPQEVVVNDGSVPESDLTNNTMKVAAPAAP